MKDQHMHRVPPAVLMSPKLGRLLQAHGDEVAALYRARVAKRTGQLAASASAHVQVGGHKHDRLIGKVLVGGSEADYGVLHEFGAPTNPHYVAGEELAEAVERWKKHRR